MSLFPDDSEERKTYPVYSGFVQYFPSAMAVVAHHSYLGNLKHSGPGAPLRHDRSKSDDEADAQLRHLMEGDFVGMAWRAMALCQKYLESKGAPIAPAAYFPSTAPVPTEEELAAKSPAAFTDADHNEVGEQVIE